MSVVAALILPCYSACAATITVTNTADSGPGSLRAAIAAAVTEDVIEFSVPLPATISLLSEIEVRLKGIVIRGPGSSQLLIRGNGQNIRVFRFNTFAELVGSTLSGVSVADGNQVGIEDGGGILLETGMLTLTDCVVRDCAAETGAGVSARPGTRLCVRDSTLSGNRANQTGGAISTITNGAATVELVVVRSTLINNSANGGWGGAIFNATSGALTVAGSRITGNVAYLGGGAIRNDGTTVIEGCRLDSNQVNVGNNTAFGGAIYSLGTLTLTEVTVSGNTLTALHAKGGGIANAGTMTINRCAILGNSASGNSTCQGGGVFNSSVLTMTNVTVSGNSVTNSPSNPSGGGVYSLNTGYTKLALIACTVAFNTAGAYGLGGVFSGDTFTCRSTIIARNSSVGGLPDFNDFSGTVTSQGFNLVGYASAGFSNGVKRDKVGSLNAQIDPLLYPLADNGGPTLTHALQAGSPALESGSPGPGVATDQRGFLRYTRLASAPAAAAGGTDSDIGAFEGGDSTLRVTSITRPDDGPVILQGAGLPRAQYSVQAASPLNAGFVTLGPVYSDAAGNLRYEDPDASLFIERFYRFSFP